jgi:hypothetical protein
MGDPAEIVLAPGALVPASELLDEEEDPGDFEPGRYKGFEILPPAEWPTVKEHSHIDRRFYVRHNDTIGLVPWPGSKICWPWEAGWEQDLHRSQVQSLIRPERKAKKR